MIDVAVETIVSRRDWGVIFSATVLTKGHADHGRRIRVRASISAMSDAPEVGETWAIDGEVLDTAYGRQVDAEAARRVMPDGALVRGYLAFNVPGIGRDRASRLWDAFGDTLGTVLSDERNIPRIAEVIAPDRPLLALRIAAATVAAWRAAASEAAAMAWMDGHGVSNLAVARRVVRILGDEAVGILADNPYILVPLLPWKNVDALGRRLLPTIGATGWDVRRFVGAADETVKRALARGDTVMAPEHVRLSLGRLLKTDRAEVIEDAVQAAERNGALVCVEEGYRAPGAALMEDHVVRRLRSLVFSHAASPVRLLSPSGIAELVADVTPVGRPLHSQQTDAVLRILCLPVACLTGGGGTGKTYTCKVLCDAWERLGGEVLPCALAGKAALRLSRSTRRLARTLARTLGELDERDRLDRVIDDPEADEKTRSAASRKRETLARIATSTLVLIDEASMVDLPTVHAIVRRMPDGARLLLVGDPAQLPPVGFGLVFHRLVADDGITSHLTHVHRQAAETGIPVAAAQVRSRCMPIFERYAGVQDGVSFVAVEGAAFPGTVERVALELGILEGGSIIVTATNDGEAGVKSLNEMLHDRHAERTGNEPMRGVLGRFFSAGAPVIFGRNDYRLGLFNGMLGRVTRTFPDDRALEVIFEGESDCRRLTEEHLVDLDLAYAVTCHKCQGSSAPRVVVPIYQSRVLDPSWLYTALTRGERQVVFVGESKVFRDSLALPFAAERRQVGLRWAELVA
ncbi:AAA family ATPase [Methylobacterium sp. AMS5]|uniref:AAA family ATPase n=1 Tax=Methylobacterium sp. AMS5 TaxID=925818 RepID=UPI00074F9AB1|nr:AAA family ATPase [Methylobacterium sp. AMS5]AMB44056.1 hypothetical protein Y590_04045 [Methylobacterium sp. AMS5]